MGSVAGLAVAASVAAARLLQHNYSVTKDWALALTAYNHGLAGIRRAVRTVGSSDIADLIEYYNGRTWGFASRNFYAAFLAAAEVDFQAHKYFGIVDREDPIVSETIELPFFVSAATAMRAFDVDEPTLRELNRSLRTPIWDGRKRIPRGFELRLPSRPDRPTPRQMLANVDASQRYFVQVPDRYHRVRRGESLSTIAARYGASVRDLTTLNNLRSRNLIRAGQTLRLPVSEPDTTVASDGTYTVRRGDTLSGIAQRVGLNVAALVATNDLRNADSIQPGQKLRVDGTRPAQPEDDTATPATESGNETVVARAETMERAAEEEAASAQGDATSSGEPEKATAPVAEPGPSETLTADADETPPAREDAESTEEVVASETEPATAPVDGSPAPLSADPSDYAVAEDRTIEVQAAETLGHYAEWLDLRASQLRRVNRMRYGTPVVIGKRLELDFSRVEPSEFERRRLAYHEEIQGRFFDQFRIAGTSRQLVKGGDSLWTLARRSDNVPVWLLRQYNPDLDFDDPEKVTEANPQQSEYLWGTAEIYEWTSADGIPLQGILYKPEGFDPSQQYPMMVYFYERNSDDLHEHHVPAAGRSVINFSFYASRGYVVFVPDIPYKIGYPGESAMNAVMPGVTQLMDEGYVDRENIGVQGHSWGGYRIAYMVTRTNLFAAAEAGAPVSNMTSAYGGIRWGSGMSRMFQYEDTQSRIGGSLWEKPLRYIENSPIFWADKIETPLMMMHNDHDTAVPWEQGIELFVALRRLGKPAWLINYNDEPHWPTTLANKRDWTKRMQQFFDHYLKDAPAPVWLDEGVPAIEKGRTLGLEPVVTDPER